MSRTEALERLVELLKQEAAALKAGRLNDATALTPAKNEALAILESESGLHGDQVQQEALVERVRRLADENRILLDAARQGLARVATVMIGSDRDVAVGVFDRDGSRKTFSESAGLLRRKL